MMHLARDRFAQARAFAAAHARPLDWRLFQWYFESGSAEAVLTELAAYQNADGGFGHGIEPDFRLAASSPMATSVGLQYCREVQADADHPIVRAAVGYLLATYELEGDYWPATFLDVNEEPHAPWWHVDRLTPPDEATWPNPSAELVGYLHCYAAAVPPATLERITRRAQQNITHPDAMGGSTPNFYNLLCWQRALPYLPDLLQPTVQQRLAQALAAVQPLTQARLEEMRIFWLAPSPQSPMTQHFPETVRQLLTEELARQAEDGGWWPTWQWGQYPDVWPVARREWAGKLTVDCLHALREHGALPPT